MNKRIDFTQIGGAPITQDTLQWLQDSYRNAFKAFAGFVGNLVIVSGMQEVGGNVTDGWLIYNGELIPFVGGAIATDIVVTEIATAALFEDGASHDFYFEKVAQFGGPATFAYAELKRKSLTDVCTIKPWPGLIAKIPAGWYQCDGSLKNIADFPEAYDLMGTLHGGDGVTTFALPNIKSRTIVGYDTGDADYDTVGKTSGEKEHTLLSDEQGKIDVSQKRDDIGGGSASVTAALKINGVDVPTDGASNQAGYGTTAHIPANDALTAHNNVQPSIALPYIIKLK